MRFLGLVLAGVLICGEASLMAQDSRSPDTQKQQHPENNPKPKTSTGTNPGSSQLNQGDVPKDMPSDGASTSTRSGQKKKAKAKDTSTTR